MRRVDEVRELFAYHRWANARMLEAAGMLSAEDFARDLGSGFPSVRATLAHLLSADWIWLERWRGTSPIAGPDWDTGSHAALTVRWGEVERDQRAFLDGLLEADLDQVVSYRALNGAPFSNPLGELCRHVVNHGTHHRGQVATLLRQLGAKPPQTDLILYYRERGPRA
jgi:uncharacterized damage-inducible protein DinB